MIPAITDPNNVLGTNVDTIEQITAFVNLLGGGPAVAALAAAAGTSQPIWTTHTFVSGTPYVNATAVKQTARVQITGGTAGTIGITLTDTQASPVTHTLVPVTAADAVASQDYTIPIPAGWSATVTVSVATIVASSVITSGL
jgi:hypothetical protein